MFQIIQQVRRSPFVRNVAAMASGTAASQVISMIFAPVITRLYGPEAYGIQSVFMSIAGICASIAAMTYPVAIVLPESDSVALALARLSIYVGVVTSLLTLMILFFWGAELLFLLNAEQIIPYIYLVPVFMLVSVFGEVVAQWLIRKRAFNLTANINVAQSIITSTIKTFMGFLNPSATVLVVTNTFGGLLEAMLMVLGLRRGYEKNLLYHNERNPPHPKYHLWELANQHRDFPLLRTPQVLLNAVSQTMPMLLLASYFGATAAGF
jgi:O-antigen/teichoic acid export membrane protein